MCRPKKPRSVKTVSLSPPISLSQSANKTFPGITCPLSKPQIPPGEDKASFEHHNNALVLEFRKSNPNMTVVNSLMDASFAMRWEDIHENPCSIEVILDKYPFLQSSDQV